MKRLVILGAFAMIAFAQTACVSMSSMQTAETLEKGKNQVTLGGGYYSSNETAKDDTTKFQMPYLETSYREGLAENLDAGLKLTIIGSAAADVKYRFLKGDRFNMAIGGGLGYMSMSTGSGDNEIKNTIYDIMVPLYVSYKLSNPFTVYTTPRYVLRVSERGGSESGTIGSSLYGGAAGMKIGEKWGVYLEAAYQKDLRSNFDMMQYNLAFFWSTPSSLLASAGL